MGLSVDHLEPLCRELAGTDAVTFELAELGGAQGVISRYEASTREAIIGHRLLTIHAAGVERRFVIKSKAPGSTIRRRLEAVYERIDPELAALQHRLAPSILDACHTRELAVYGLATPSLRAVVPAIARLWRDDAQQIYVIVMELLDGVRHASTLDDLDVWQDADIACALRGIAAMHRELLGAPPAWLLPFEVLHNAALLDYQAALVRYNATALPELFDAPRTRLLEGFLASAAERHRTIVRRPLTLIHGDFTPRNVCLRPGPRLCAYDWELAQADLPARDVCELLCYVLDPRRGWRTAAPLLAEYRAALGIDAADFREDLALALEEFCTFKLLVQGITHRLLGKRAYFERMVANAFDGIAAVKEARV